MDTNTKNEKTFLTRNISIFKNTSSLLSRLLTQIKDFLKKNIKNLKYLLILIPLILTLIIAREAQKQQLLRTKAAVHQASVYIQPSNWTLPPEGTFDIFINSNYGLGFSHIEVTFDPNIVKLTGEISTDPVLSKVVKVSSMTEANSSGKMAIVLGLDPTQKSNPPSGTFKVATFKLNANTTNNAPAMLNFDNAAVFLVAMDETVFTTTTTGLNLIVNPTPIPSQSPTPTATAAPTDTTPPTVTVNSPKDGSTIPNKGTLKISVSAKDESGISSIEIFFDGTSKKVCTGTTSCSYNLGAKDIAKGVHTVSAEAKDKSANKNTSSSSVNLSK